MTEKYYKKLKLRDIMEMLKEDELEDLILVATKSHGHTLYLGVE